MLRLFRVRAWCFATALFLATGTVSASLEGLLHADADHDIACAPASDAAHDATAHRVRSAGDADASAAHCLACHWARSFRTHGGSAQPPIRLASTDGHFTVHVVLLLPAPSLAHRSPRAPPAPPQV